MPGLLHDIRLAIRLLTRDRRFTIAAVVALGLGIGLNTSVFAIINAAFLRDLPLSEPHRLVAIQFRDSRQAVPGRDIYGPVAGDAVHAVSYDDLRDWREQTSSFEGIAANASGTMNLSDAGAAPERLRGSYLTANTFRILRVAPILGRDFVDEDDRPGAPGVVMLGFAAWQSRYGGDPAVIGRTVRVNDVPATIIGVMPRGFNYPLVDHMWQSIASAPNFGTWLRTTRNLSLVARLKPSVDLPAARAELDAVAARLAEQFPDSHGNLASFARPLRDFYNTPPIQLIATMMGAVGFVLLIAYANLANLLLARSITRAREIAIRTSLGATRLRVIRQLMVECLIIAIGGGALGFVLSMFGVQEIAVAFEPIEPGRRLGTNLPFWVDISPNAMVFGFVGLISIASALCFGLLPAWQMSKTNLHETLKEEGRAGGGSRRGRWWSSVLLTAELALVLMLLSGAGLLWRSFIERYREQTVIDTAGVVTMRLALPAQKYPAPADRKRFLEQLNQRLRGMTVFSAVTMAGHVPLEFGAPVRQLFIDGTEAARGEKPPLISYVLTGGNYFSALNVPIVRGRALEPLDARLGQESAVVDERFAERFFPKTDPIGRRIRPGTAALWYTIVGVARSLPQSGPPPELRPIVYAPLEAEQAPDGRAAIIVKGPIAAASAALREEVRAMDATLPLFAIETLDDARARGRLPARIIGTWFTALALVALVLAGVGVFAMTAHNVAQRRYEMGVRMALGAAPGDVVRLFLRRILFQLAIGTVLGLAGTLAIGAALGFALRELRERDPLTFAIVTCVLASVALFSTLLPARRAARLDPAVTLRE